MGRRAACARKAVGSKQEGARTSRGAAAATKLMIDVCGRR